MSSPMTQDKHTGLGAAALEAAEAEYARWGTGCDTSRLNGHTSWVGRQNDDGSWHEVSSHASLSQAEDERRNRALNAAVSAAVSAPDNAGDREGVETKVLDVRPQFGCPSAEPSIRMLIHAYYARHFSQAQADDLTARYLAALSTGNEEPGREGAIGYLNVYRDEDGDFVTGCTDLYGSAKEAEVFNAAEFSDHVGVFALVPASSVPTPPVSPEPDSRAGVEPWNPTCEYRINDGCCAHHGCHCAEIASLRAALQSAPTASAGNGWPDPRPLSEAPQDGTLFLVASLSGTRPTLCSFRDSYFRLVSDNHKLTGFRQWFWWPLPNLFEPDVAAPTASAAAGPVVDILRMRLSDGRTDYFVRLTCGDRSLTPHVFRERWKAEYEVAQWQYMLGQSDEEPSFRDYDETSYPNDATPTPAPHPVPAKEGR